MIKKILLTLGIIGLGIINFSYGRYDERGPRFGNAVIGTEFTNVHEQYLTLFVDKDINFKSTKGATEKDIFAVYAYQGNNGSTAYWFYWNTRGELSAYARDWERTNARGGKLTYYYVCDDFELPFTNFTGCIEYLYTGTDIGVVNNYLSYVNSGDDIIYGQAADGSTVNNGMFSPFIAFNIPNKNKSIVFYFKPYRGYALGYNLPYDYYNAYGIDNEYNVKYHIEEFPDSLIGESPIIGGNSGGFDIPENGFPNTNRGVFDAYAEEGYVLKWCYSDFSLDNLATSTGGISQFYDSELDDGVYYTGSSVLDLFIEYGYGNSFESFFDYWYNTYIQSLRIESPLKYVGLSKGLWTMSDKYYYAGLSNRYIDYTKFYNYCNYFVDFDGDWDAEYTGPQLPNDVANQLAPSQSAIDYLSGFIHSQLSSGNNQNFDADSFFTSLTTRFDRLLNNINGSFIGIIPGYILVIMMALIFIRIISH